MNVSRTLFLLTLLTSVCSAQEPKAGATVPGVEGSKPNIVIIFTDDQGYADLGCYGNQKNKTPRMDQLAREGTRFTSFYAQSVCGPSRSALLTGRYPIRSKGWAMPASEITFAELIRDAGYQTACIGKWDVSNRRAIIDRMPNAQGFDYYFGALGANDAGRVTFHENNNEAGRTTDMASLTTLYTDKAIDFLENRRDPNKPFVLYLAHTMMHTVIDASERFRGKSRGGLYGDVVEEFDYETGRLLDTLEELGLRKDTLVIYTTDNGPWNQPAYYESKMGLRPDPDLKYGSNNKKRPAGFFQEKGTIFWGESGPLRNGKGSCYEGGSRVPCIVRWPGKVPAGKTSDAIFATIDFLPTFAALAGFEVPDDRIIDGVDQSELLLGHSRDGARQTFFYQGNGVRQGKWKYLQAVHGKPFYWLDHYRKEVEELYDLDSDIGETTNLAEKYPEKLEELRALMKSIAEGKNKAAAISAQELKADVETPATKRDILFIAIDDMNDWTTVFDKNNPIQTPNLERLAARGAFFENAYCASASCNPSRTATLTGLRPTTSGVYHNPDPWGEMLPDVITLPQVFKHNGYAAIGAGKIFTHGKAGAEQKDNPSFDAFYKLQSAGKSKLHADKSHMNYNGYPDGKRFFDWGEHDTDKQADEHTVEYVNEVMASHPREKPLFLAAGIYRPHMPFFAPPRTFEKYPFHTLRMPPMPENDLADVPPLGVEMARISLAGWNYTSQKPDDHPGSLKKMVQSYQAASDFADEMVGRLLDQLDQTGRAENTIIVLWSDHGYHLGDKTSCGKTTLWEKANHVPFIIVAPGITQPGTRIDTPVSLVDIYPTLLDLAGLPAKPDLDGQSLVPLLKDPQARWERPALMTEGRGNHAVRSRDWRYIRYKDGTEELYDCKTDDPWNHTNLLAGEDRDKYASVVAEHQKWLPKDEAPERDPLPKSKKKKH